MNDDYDTDLVMWSEHQAELLRRIAAGEHINDQVDWENVAEEIEALGRSERREMRNRVGTILFHLIKLQVSPASLPRPSWSDTVEEQQRRLRQLIEDSPVLRSERADEPGLATVIVQELAEAKARVVRSLAAWHERPVIDLAGLEYTEGQVLGPWLPPSDSGA